MEGEMETVGMDSSFKDLLQRKGDTSGKSLKWGLFLSFIRCSHTCPPSLPPPGDQQRVTAGPLGDPVNPERASPPLRVRACPCLSASGAVRCSSSYRTGFTQLCSPSRPLLWLHRALGDCGQCPAYSHIQALPFSSKQDSSSPSFSGSLSSLMSAQMSPSQ